MTSVVDDYARELGISKRWAYELLRQQSEAEATQVPIPHNQRERVLSILYRRGDEIRNSISLNAALHEEGFETDGHDTTKVLWSLQKTNHVKFREHQSPRYLYAIRLTDQGKADAYRLVTTPPGVPQVTMVVEPEREPEPEPDEAVLFQCLYWSEHQHSENNPPTQECVDEFQARLRARDPVAASSYPSITKLRERSTKAQKLIEAARLLEEAGEDDIALALMGKTEFSDLEVETLEILEKLGVRWV